MSVNSMNMLQTKGQMQAQDLEFKQNQVTALGKSNMSEAEKEKKLREACEGFESIFIQKMWQQMRATLPQENPLVGREEKFWQSMYDQELAKKMTSSGGIGLADMMYDQLSKNLVSASRTTADSSNKSTGFEIAATPLMPKQNAMAEAESGKSALQAANPTNGANAMSANIYEGAATGHRQVSANNNANVEAQAKLNPNVNAQANPSQEASANAPLVQEYLTNLLAKQTGQPNAVANNLTGPELARQAQLAATSQPPLHGVLPAQNAPISGNALQAQNALASIAGVNGANVAGANMATAATALLQSQISGQPMQNIPTQQVIRTTYTTNLPENERSAQPRVRATPKQLLTSGQPMVQTPSSAAYAYGASQASTSKKAGSM